MLGLELETNKRATENKKLFKILLLDVIKIIQEMNEGLVHWEKFSTVVVQLNSHIRPILRIKSKSTYTVYQ